MMMIQALGYRLLALGKTKEKKQGTATGYGRSYPKACSPKPKAQFAALAHFPGLCNQGPARHAEPRFWTILGNDSGHCERTLSNV